MCKKYIIGIIGLFLGVQSTQSWGGWRLENVRPITTKEDGWFMRPQWSPDGKKVAFTKVKWRGIYVKNADGSGEIEEIAGKNVCSSGSVWSPDGNGILFRAYDENQIKIKRVRLDNKGIISVITPIKKSVIPSPPYWLSNGDFSYVETEKSGIEAEKDISTIIICDSKGKIKKRLNPGFWIGGKVSPDGRKIVYFEPRVRGKIVSVDTTHVWLTDSDGMNKKLLLKGRYRFLGWCPDSKKILISTGGGYFQFVFDIETEKRFDLGRGANGCWSSDREWILYTITEDDGHYLTASDIYIIRWDGTEKNQLTYTQDLIEVNPVFSPDGNKIAFETIGGIIFVTELNKK